MRRAKGKKGKARPENKPIFRYWVEVLELKTGSMATLPLTQITKIHIPRKKSDPQRPNDEILQLEDGSVKLEAKTLDDLAAQLRQRYSDGEYERRLHRERDREAEERWERGMNGLMRILAEAAVERILRETEP